MFSRHIEFLKQMKSSERNYHQVGGSETEEKRGKKEGEEEGERENFYLSLSLPTSIQHDGLIDCYSLFFFSEGST